MLCRFCHAHCSLFLDMSHIPFCVTSDAEVIGKGFKLYRCKSCELIQKESNRKTQESYFANFFSHALSDGEEQVKFVDGIAYPRSELILKNIKDTLPKHGAILDIGSGSGSFLKSFGKFFPLWELYAQDIQDNSMGELLQIVPQEHIFIKDIKRLRLKMDCISLIHTLGHIVELNDFLTSLKKLSQEETKLIIHTPDLQDGFFDVVIIDQINHFTQESLIGVLSSHFTNINFHSSVYKELTALIDFSILKTPSRKLKPSVEQMRERFEAFINFLYRSQKSYVILGTAPASTYIAALLRERFLYFVDEDEQKIGKIHQNKKIRRCKDVKMSEVIVLPFLDESIVTDIQKRYKNLDFFSFMDINHG